MDDEPDDGIASWDINVEALARLDKQEGSAVGGNHGER
jgi:hypothetical protein